MPSFKKDYRLLFEVLGYPLTERLATPHKQVSHAEQRLGTRVPAALRDYYFVAGKEQRFNQCHNRLLAPQDWSIDKQRLIFMEENQSVSYWGVSIRNSNTPDPSVSQGMNDDSITWLPEHRKCSVFLTVILHYHAVAGGFRFCGRADVPENSDYGLEDNGWTFQGKVNSLWAYSRPNQVVCLVPPGDVPFLQNWSILAGAKTERSFRAISEEIGVTFK